MSDQLTQIGPAAESVFARTVAPRAPLYALLDKARESAGIYQASKAGLKYESLFAGEMGDQLSEVAPYLIEFPIRSSFRQWWFEQWGNSIGVLLEAPAGFEDLRRHFRTLMMVRGEDRKRYFFRFYDPRVLTAFLPACTSAELDRFLGPITAFYCESSAGRELATFSRKPDGTLIHRQSPVSAKT
jgi:hypothetical protein